MSRVEFFTTESSPTRNPVFQKEGPRLFSIDTRAVDRQGRLGFRERGTYPLKEREFTEAQGIDNLTAFIDTVIRFAGEQGDAKMLEYAMAFKENLVYIGDKEFEEAVRYIAGGLADIMRRGKELYIWVSNVRSERYTAIKIFDALENIISKEKELAERLHFSRDNGKIAEASSTHMENAVIIVPDDFVISGNRLRGAMSSMIMALVEHGISKDRAMEMVIATLICSSAKENVNKFTKFMGEEDKAFKMFSYFSAPEYHDREGGWYVTGGASFSGSHCSTDYGFEQPIEEFCRYLEKGGQTVSLPLLHGIKRPYECKPYSDEFRDPEMQRRWELYCSRYQL